MVDVEIISRSMVDQDSATLLLTPTKRDHVVPLVGGVGTLMNIVCVKGASTTEPLSQQKGQTKVPQVRTPFGTKPWGTHPIFQT